MSLNGNPLLVIMCAAEFAYKNVNRVSLMGYAFLNKSACSKLTHI